MTEKSFVRVSCQNARPNDLRNIVGFSVFHDIHSYRNLSSCTDAEESLCDFSRRLSRDRGKIEKEKRRKNEKKRRTHTHFLFHGFHVRIKHDCRFCRFVLFFFFFAKNDPPMSFQLFSCGIIRER